MLKSYLTPSAWQSLQQEQAKRTVERARAKSNAPTRADFERALVIQDKHERLIPFRPNRAQLHFREHRTRRNLVLKSRQVGFSTEIQSEHFLEENIRRVRTATLAHDDDGTAKLRRMASCFWENLPDNLRPARGLANATTTTYLTTGAEAYTATAGSKHKGRAGTYSLVHGSEVAFWPDAALTMAGIMQGVPPDGEITLESTANGAQGYFYEKCMEALDGDSDWALFFYEWWWSDEYQLPLTPGETLVYSDDEQRLVDAHGLSPEQIKWRRSKQRELGRLFPQEYPEDPRTCFLTSGNGYFSDLQDIEAVFRAPRGVTPERGHEYVAGLDFGQQEDFTALSIGDATTGREVELLRINHLPWKDMRFRIATRCRYWNVATLIAEANSMGSTNIEELRSDMGNRTQVQSFHTTARSKPSLIQALHFALDEGGLELLPDSNGRHEIVNFIASQTPSGAWKYEAANGSHDDTVIARALLWRGMTHPVQKAESHQR